MFERFTDRARRVIVLALEEARLFNHNYIGTEHILLGLSREGEGVAAKSLESLNVSLEAVQAQVEQMVGRGQDTPTGHIPFTPRAKKVLELSLGEPRSSATTTSAPSTSYLASSRKAKVWAPRFCGTSAHRSPSFVKP